MTKQTKPHNLRHLGLSLNVPPSSPQQLSPQQPEMEQPPPLPQFEYEYNNSTTDDGYYYDEDVEGFGNEDQYNFNSKQDPIFQGEYYDDEMEEDEGLGVINDPFSSELDGEMIHTNPGVSEKGNTKVPMIHPALVNALNQHKMNQEGNDIESNSVMTTNTQGGLMDNSVSNLILTPPKFGGDEVEESNQGLESSQERVEEEPDKNDWEEEGVEEVSSDPEVDEAGLLGQDFASSPPGDAVTQVIEEFESIPPPTELDSTSSANLTLDTLGEEGASISEAENEVAGSHAVGDVKEAIPPSDEILNIRGDENQTLDGQNFTGDNSSSAIMFPDEKSNEPLEEQVEVQENEEQILADEEGSEISNEEEADEILNDESQGYHEVGDVKTFDYEDEDLDETGVNRTDVSLVNMQLEEEESEPGLNDESPEELESNEETFEAEQNESEENAQNSEEPISDEEDEKKIIDNKGPGEFKGFDEDFTSEHIDKLEMDPLPDLDENEDQVTANLEENNHYAGDGFMYHILPPKSREHGSSSNISLAAMIALVSFFVCFCCIRYRRRRMRYSKPNRGKYSALGSNEFFNGTFSDDISFNGKDSDDEMSYGSDDDYGDGVKIELGGIHETDANGGLTLEEING